MRLWYRLAVTGDIKQVPMNWDECMLQDCHPSIPMSDTFWQEYQARCPTENAPDCESFVDQEGDYDMGGNRDERDNCDDSEFYQQGRSLVLQLLAACGPDKEMKRRVLDHLEGVLQDVQLMASEPSGATRESGRRIRPMYER